jgi:hypothetical protein
VGRKNLGLLRAFLCLLLGVGSVICGRAGWLVICGG